MAHERHQREQRHARAGEDGPKGVHELVGGEMNRVLVAQVGGGYSGLEPDSKAVNARRAGCPAGSSTTKVEPVPGPELKARTLPP